MGRLSGNAKVSTSGPTRWGESPCSPPFVVRSYPVAPCLGSAVKAPCTLSDMRNLYPKISRTLLLDASGQSERVNSLPQDQRRLSSSQNAVGFGVRRAFSPLALPRWRSVSCVIMDRWTSMTIQTRQSTSSCWRSQAWASTSTSQQTVSSRWVFLERKNSHQRSPLSVEVLRLEQVLRTYVREPLSHGRSISST